MSARRTNYTSCCVSCLTPKQNNCVLFFFLASKQESGNRKQRRNVKVVTHWLWRGRRWVAVYRSKKHNGFWVSTQNSEDRKTFNQTQARRYPHPDRLPFFFLRPLMAKERSGGIKTTKQSWDTTLARLPTQKKSGHGENERLSTMCLGSVLVLGRGS